jgi:UDP-4-amino-4,6-dideoxy-N-acetyl-beta-L-altrosamine N-acetyltransferase
VFTFREIQPEDSKLLLNWRNLPRVADFMKTEVNHGSIEQENWILRCRERADFYHWIIIFQGTPIGYISLSKFNPATKSLSWGFYIGDDEFTRMGGLVPPFFYGFCFHKLAIERIDAEMLHTNTSVIELHRLHGYSFDPEKDRILSKKGGKFLLIGMYLEKTVFIKGRFGRFKADFTTKHWNPKENIYASPDFELRFEEVTATPEQTEILMDLLKNRKYPISHKKIPSLKQHSNFVANHPYRNWSIIYSNEIVIGAFYLTNDNAIGIDLKIDKSEVYEAVIEKIRTVYQPLETIPSVRPGYFFLNLAPGNHVLADVLKQLGSEKTQSSFRLC